MTQIKDSWKQKGYVDEPIPEGIDLKAEIRRMCKEKNAIILAHYYTEGVLQDIADFVGDSLGLAQQAARTDADIILMCGVHFMGETNKILCPEKTVLVPDLNATCSLAESCQAEDFRKFVEAHPGYEVISYVNTSAAVKALTDVVVTSSNAKKIVDTFLNQKAEDGFSVVVSHDEIKAKGYTLSAGQYFDVKIEYVPITADEFAEKIAGFKSRLAELNAKGAELDRTIATTLDSLKLNEHVAGDKESEG